MQPPPSFSRRNFRLTLLAHPFELAIGAALAINGVRGFFGGLSPSMTTIPAVSLYLFLITSTLGGIGVVIGLILNDPPQHQGFGKALERSSLFLVASSYGALALIIVGVNGWPGVATGIITLLIAGACLLRARAIKLAAEVILEQLEARNAQNDREDDDHA
jgi:hypothetical protein